MTDYTQYIGKLGWISFEGDRWVLGILINYNKCSDKPFLAQFMFGKPKTSTCGSTDWFSKYKPFDERKTLTKIKKGTV